MKSGLKIPWFVLFRANLTRLGPKSNISDFHQTFVPLLNLDFLSIFPIELWYFSRVILEKQIKRSNRRTILWNPWQQRPCLSTNGQLVVTMWRHIESYNSTTSWWEMFTELWPRHQWWQTWPRLPSNGTFYICFSVEFDSYLTLLKISFRAELYWKLVLKSPRLVSLVQDWLSCVSLCEIYDVAALH